MTNQEIEELGAVLGRFENGGVWEVGDDTRLIEGVRRLIASLKEAREALLSHRGRDEAMHDSQYLAGVTAGWNAAQADDPNAALSALHKSRSGYLRALVSALKERG